MDAVRTPLDPFRAKPSYWPGQYGVWRLPGSLRNKSSAGRWTGSQRHAKKLEGNRGTHGFCGTGESGVPTHPRKDSRAEKRPSASKIETREASNDGPGLGDPQGKGHGPDRPDQSGSVGQDSKGIMHARVGRTPGIRDARGPRGQREPGKGRHIRDGAGGSPEGRHRLIYCNLGIHGLVWKVFRRFVNGWVVSFQARFDILAMIANTKTGGQMAADLTRSIDATDDDKIVPTSGSTDHTITGELNFEKNESCSATSSRDPYLTPSPLGALWGAAAEEEGGPKRRALGPGKLRKANW